MSDTTKPNHTSFSRVILLVATVVLASGMLVSDSPGMANGAKCVRQADPEVQTFIESLLSANEQEILSGTTEEEVRRQLNQLQQMVGGSKSRLVEQLFCFRLNAQGMRDALLPIIIMEQVSVSKPDLVRGVMPYLNSQDMAVVKDAVEWLRAKDKDRATETYDFDHYVAVLEESARPDTTGLIRYLYQRDPETALLTMARVYAPDAEGEFSARLRGNPEDALEYCRDRPEWWAHLYVAAMMEEDPRFRTPENLARLEQDLDPLVRETVSKLKGSLQPVVE